METYPGMLDFGRFKIRIKLGLHGLMSIQVGTDVAYLTSDQAREVADHLQGFAYTNDHRNAANDPNNKIEARRKEHGA